MQKQWRSVLLNPAIHPARDLYRHIAQHPACCDSQEKIYLRAEYGKELENIAQQTLQHEAHLQQHIPACFALICQGDEVLDWREMLQRYPYAYHKILEGNNHAISDFENHWPLIVDWIIKND